jgi:translation initiation factor 6
MPLDRLRVFGNPNIGVYIFANNKVALVPEGCDPEVKEKVRDNLDVEVIEARIAGSVILGVFLAGNDNVILAPKIARDEEIESLNEVGLNVKVFHSVYTALGNILLINNKAALVYPDLTDREVKILSEELGVETIVKGTIARIPTVGSAAVITDKGGLTHPDTNEDELRKLSELFGVNLDIGTVNFGVAFIRTGLVANNHGALIGEKTTGPEIMRIMKALNMG